MPLREGLVAAECIGRQWTGSGRCGGDHPRTANQSSDCTGEETTVKGVKGIVKEGHSRTCNGWTQWQGVASARALGK